MASYSIDNEYGGYETNRFQKDVDENFHCSICYNVLKEPRMCQNNEHMFCLSCVTHHLNLNSEKCPQCNEYLTVSTLREAPRVVNNYLSELKIKCDFASRGCPEFIRLEALQSHVVNCGFSPVLCANEECGMEINKQDKVRHESEVCEYRKVKCHDCNHVQQHLRDLVKMNETTNKKVEALKGEMKELAKELKKVDIVKNEVRYVKDNISKVNKNMAELRVTMNQILEKLNKPDATSHSSSLSQSTPQALFRSVKYGEPSATTEMLNPSLLAQASAADQKQMLGERLFPIIQRTHPDLAPKITGMLLEIDNSELLHMLEFRDYLSAKVDEAVNVLQAHEQREQHAQQEQRAQRRQRGKRVRCARRPPRLLDS